MRRADFRSVVWGGVFFDPPRGAGLDRRLNSSTTFGLEIAFWRFTNDAGSSLTHVLWTGASRTPEDMSRDVSETAKGRMFLLAALHADKRWSGKGWSDCLPWRAVATASCAVLRRV